MPRIANRFGLALKEAANNHGIQVAGEIFRDALREKKVRKEDLSLLEMAGSFMGENWREKLDHYYHLGPGYQLALRESMDAVDASQFALIGGQLLIDTVHQKYRYAVQRSDELITTIPAGKNAGTRIEPWLSDVLDEPAPVSQLQPYPFTQFTYQTITYPAPVKDGRICAVSMEMIEFDKTAQAIESAESVGRRAGLQQHKNRMRVILGIVNNHVFNGTALNTYLTSGSWNNKLTDFTLTDWKAFNRIEQLFNQMQDPVTGEVIDIDDEEMKVLVMPFQKYTAKRILNATEVRSGNIAAAPGDQTVSANPLDGYNKALIVDKHSRKLLVNEGGLTATQADTVVVAGNFKRAFVEIEVYPTRVVQATPNNIWEFTRDIALAVKVSQYYVDGVRDPRYVFYGYNSAA